MERMSAEDLRWRARDDARTLARAEEIKSDPERMKLARQSANEILKEEADRLKGLSKVVGKKTPKSKEQEVPQRRTSATRNNMFGSFPTTPRF